MSKELILLTGASGHLGFRTLVFALKAGYKVRVALRKLEQAEKIKKARSIQPLLEDIEFVEVPDITAPGAYDEAIREVDLVIHVAAPLLAAPDASDWQKAFYEPSERGTVNMLQAAASEPKVKRVVITSTCMVVEPKNGSDRAGPYDLGEMPDEETRNSFPSAGQAYPVSKLLAHLAATEFVEKNKVHFDLIRMLPGYMQGANELYGSAEDMRDPRKLGSNSGIMLTALGMKAGGPRPTHQVFLDDVAKAHVLALWPGVAKHGDNFLLAANDGVGIPWEEFVPIIQGQFPDEVEKGILNPKMEDPPFIERYDVSASEKAFGFKFTGPEEMVKSVVGQYIDFVGAA